MRKMEEGSWAVDGRQPRIAIIGAGISGIAAVHYLRNANFTDLTVYEKGSTVGGTWRDNRYPGLSCDIASYWYSFTFSPNPGWSHRFPYRDEIFCYLESVARKLDMHRITHFDTAVKALRYQDGQWYLHSELGDEEEIYDLVISATGILHHPSYPKIPGLESFEGTQFHSSRWNDDAEIDGARVGIIGTGSTAAQIVGALGDRVGELSVFQRTPQWMFPLPQKKYGNWWKWIMANVPGMSRVMYWCHRQLLERTLGPATMGNDFAQRLFQSLCRWNLTSQVKDDVLRAKLTPNYKAGCKRLIICSSFYKSIVLDNVHLETDGIESITPKGIRTVSGNEIELDTLILCTGFHSDRYLLPVEVQGEGGVVLSEVWAGAPRAHRAMSVPDFPNLWFLEGPTGPVGNISLVSVSEIQIKYIVRCLDRMRSEGLVTIQPKRESFEAFNSELATSVKKTLWATGGCTSWYIDASGDPNLYSHPPAQFYRDMATPNFDEYKLN